MKMAFSVINLEKKELEDTLSKISPGYAIVLLEGRNKFLMISGIKDIFKILKKDVKFNPQDCLKSVETYLFDLETNKFSLLSTKGSIPKVSSFRKCVHLQDCVYLFGGITLTPKGMFKTSNDLYMLNLSNNEWTLLSNNSSKDEYPTDRFDFSFNKITNLGLLYGGISLPNETQNDELWVFEGKDNNWMKLDTKVFS
jgi:hypothetical protein